MSMGAKGERCSSLSVRVLQVQAQERAREIAATLKAPLLAVDAPSSAGIELCVGVGELRLVDPAEPKAFLALDYLRGRAGYRLGTVGRTHQPLLRAIGSLEPGEWVWDGTAGLGTDGLTLAAAGLRVRMIERRPVLVLLVRDALRRAADQDEGWRALVERIELEQADSMQRLREVAQADEAPAVVYLDPMFPARSKSASVKKEARWLQRLAGVQPDPVALAEVACAVATRRVIIKRPVEAPPLLPHPTHQRFGRSVRFDLYTTLT